MALPEALEQAAQDAGRDADACVPDADEHHGLIGQGHPPALLLVRLWPLLLMHLLALLLRSLKGEARVRRRRLGACATLVGRPPTPALLAPRGPCPTLTFPPLPSIATALAPRVSCPRTGRASLCLGTRLRPSSGRPSCPWGPPVSIPPAPGPWPCACPAITAAALGAGRRRHAATALLVSWPHP